MKHAVMDIGTKATRMLVADTEDVATSGFSFDLFTNFGELTEAGRGIKDVSKALEAPRYELQMESVQKTLGQLLKYIDMAQKMGVSPENIHVVGTEVFRRPYNGLEIASQISKICNIDLIVLDPEEEAECTSWSVSFSCDEFYLPGKEFVVIEQGGGSVQIGLARSDRDGIPEVIAKCSIPELGTVFLRQYFLEYLDSAEKGRGRYVKTVYQEVMNLASSKLKEALGKHFSNGAVSPSRAFALGSVITSFPPRKSNRHQHGREISIERMLEVISTPDPRNVLKNYANYQVRTLLRDAENLQIPGVDVAYIEELLATQYGIPCYKAVLEHFGLRSLRVCGTGMRYGVFYRLTYDDWSNVKRFQPDKE